MTLHEPSSPPAATLSPGSVLGKYRLIRSLAVGGMAEIYQARADGREGFEKKVVLKRILPQFSSQPDFVQMFLDEARITSMLDHPNIVHVHDFGQSGGDYFLCMEYVRGKEVREILAELYDTPERIPLNCVVAIALGMTAGLHHAHEATDSEGVPAGIVHRDVSPSNILVSYDGAVKVLDFGVAKAVVSKSRTRAGTRKGKLAYMSPEQCRGDKLDRRSDVFSAGIVLYEMITGTRLFAGETDFEILYRIAHEDAPSPRARRDIPVELERIALKALARNCEDRYQTAEHFYRDLYTFACSEGLQTSPYALASYLRTCFSEEHVRQRASSDSELRRFLDAQQVLSDPSIEVLEESGPENFAEGSGEQSRIVTVAMPPKAPERSPATRLERAWADSWLVVTVFVLVGWAFVLAPDPRPRIANESSGSNQESGRLESSKLNYELPRDVVQPGDEELDAPTEKNAEAVELTTPALDAGVPAVTPKKNVRNQVRRVKRRKRHR